MLRSVRPSALVLSLLALPLAACGDATVKVPPKAPDAPAPEAPAAAEPAPPPSDTEETPAAATPEPETPEPETPADEPPGGDAASAPGGSEAADDVDWSALFAPGDSWKQWPQVFTFNNSAEPETLDPHLMTGVPEHTLALALFEGLTTHHPETLEPLPGVAERWEMSDDGLVYTFHLREDAAWSNGDTVTADDFVWSWKRVLDPLTASQYAYQLYAVKNAKAFLEKQVTDFSKVGVAALDPHTLRVTLEQPTPYFLDLTSFETLMPVHQATVEKYGDTWTQPGKFVGNGPFVLTAWRPRDEIEMIPNPHYWNRGIVRLTTIHAKATDDLNTSYNEYLAGSLDWIKAVPQKRIDEVQRHPDYYVWPYLGSYFFRFNVTKKPFDDPRVRKAFDQAVNKESLCRDTLKAGQIPAMGHVPPGIYGYPQLEGLPYDPKQAKQLLAEAGYPGGKGFPSVALTYNTSESHKQICEVLASMWREVLGVEVQLRNLEWQVYLKDVENLQYQVARAGWIGDYGDPNTFMDMFVTGGGNNSTGWSNKEYDRLIAEAAREQDKAKRMDLFQRAEKILCVDEMPILPIYYYVNQGLLRGRVKGLAENNRDLHPFQYIYLDGPPAKPK